MKRTFTILLLALAFLSVSAETKERALENRHEVRLGVGDHIFIPWYVIWIYGNILMLENTS